MARPLVTSLMPAPSAPNAVSGPEVLLRDHFIPLLQNEDMAADVVTHHRSAVMSQLEAQGVPLRMVRFAGARSALRFSRDLRRVLPTPRPDVLITHGPIVWDTLVAREALRLRLPYIVVRHVVREDLLWSPLKQRIGGPLDDWTLKRAAAVVFVSPNAQRRTLDRLPLDPARAQVIFYPVNLERFRPAPPRPTSTPVRIAAVGQLTPNKGWDTFLEAMAAVRQAGPNVQAKIYGQGPLRDDLVQQIHALNLAEAVELIPYEPHMERALQEADLYCSCSRREGLSIAAAEAAACGLPMVLTRVAGSEVLVAPGENGFIEAIGDAAAVARRLTELAGDAPRRQRFAQASRARAQRFFSPQGIRQQYAALIRRVLAEAVDGSTKR